MNSLLFKLTFVLFLWYFQTNVGAMKFTMERIVPEYYNPKYVRDLNVSVIRENRKSPGLINVKVELLATFGNNETITLDINEYNAGKQVPLAIFLEYKVCDFLNHDKLVGKTLGKQILGELKCPFVPGKYDIKNIVARIEDVPFPTFWRTKKMRLSIDLKGFLTATNEQIFFVNLRASVEQK